MVVSSVIEIDRDSLESSVKSYVAKQREKGLKYGVKDLFEGIGSSYGSYRMIKKSGRIGGKTLILINTKFEEEGVALIKYKIKSC